MSGGARNGVSLSSVPRSQHSLFQPRCRGCFALGYSAVEVPVLACGQTCLEAMPRKMRRRWFHCGPGLGADLSISVCEVLQQSRLQAIQMLPQRQSTCCHRAVLAYSADHIDVPVIQWLQR